MFHKIHKVAGEKEVLAVADKELVGKTLKGKGLEFEVGEKFYKGEKISRKKLKDIIHDFEIVNLVGNNAVSVALEENLASDRQVIEISGIKHLQIMVV